ncbi:hypothetical protein OH77DRAFT_568694 [Trametes cingulata]|nr:hypothetical protein OH77DRAFT_568694 [Trametes cingulata]
MAGRRKNSMGGCIGHAGGRTQLARQNQSQQAPRRDNKPQNYPFRRRGSAPMRSAGLGRWTMLIARNEPPFHRHFKRCSEAYRRPICRGGRNQGRLRMRLAVPWKRRAMGRSSQTAKPLGHAYTSLWKAGHAAVGGEHGPMREDVTGTLPRYSMCLDKNRVMTVFLGGEEAGRASR